MKKLIVAIAVLLVVGCTAIIASENVTVEGQPTIFEFGSKD